MTNIARKARDWFRNENSGTRMPAERRLSGNLSPYPASYFGPLSNFFSDMDQMFADTFRNFGLPAGIQGMGMQMFIPNINITSNDNEYTLTVEVPGMEEKDIKLDISADGVLTISGEKRKENTENRQDVYSTECSYGAFERTLTLPEDVDSNHIEARFKNGVLTITCPRMESARQSRHQIPINSGRSSEDTRASNANERGTSSQGPKKAA